VIESGPVAPPRVEATEVRRYTHHGYWRQSLIRVSEDRLGLAMGLVLLLMAVIAILAPVLVTVIVKYQPDQQDLLAAFQPPNPHHWLGTDDLGRDTLSRLLYGSRVSLGVAAMTVALTLTIGTTVGIMAGFYRGWVDDLLMRLLDVLLAVPAIFFFILLSIIFRPNPFSLAIIIASISWMSVARLVRADVLATANLDFMLASRSIGATNFRLMTKHLMPAVIPVIVVAASLAVGQIILVEAALDFLGLGIRPPEASWGNMVASAQDYLSLSVWVMLFPGATIFISVVATNLFGNAVREAFDPAIH
jgi:peptide/nickel transport system permease protein